MKLLQKVNSPKCDICGVVLPPVSRNYKVRVRCTYKENPSCYRRHACKVARKLIASKNISFREYEEHICFNCNNWKKITRIDKDVWVWCPATNRETRDVDSCEDNWIPFIGDGKNKKEEELLEEKGVLE